MAENSKGFFERLFQKKEQVAKEVDDAVDQSPVAKTLDVLNKVIPAAQGVTSENLKDAGKNLKLGFDAKAIKVDVKTQIEQEIANGNFPATGFDKTLIAKEISEGKYSLSDFVGKYKRKLSRESYAKEKGVNPKDDTFIKDFNSKYDDYTSKVKTGISDLILSDDLPLDKEIMDRLKEFPHEIKDAMMAYGEYKKTSNFYVPPEKLGDKIEAMKKEGFDMKATEAMFRDKLDRKKFYFDKAVQGMTFDIFDKDMEPMYWADEIGGGALSLTTNIASDIMLTKAVGAMATRIAAPVLTKGGQVTLKVAEKIASESPKTASVLKSVSSGLGKAGDFFDFGKLSKTAATARAMSKEAYLTSKAAQSLAMIDEAKAAFDAANKFKSVATKSSLKLMFKEQLVLGTMVGGTKGTRAYMKGEEDLTGAISTTLADAAFYSLGSLAMAGGSKALGKAGTKAFSAFGDTAEKEIGKGVGEYLKFTGDEGISTLFPSIRKKGRKEFTLLTDYLSDKTVQDLAEKGVPKQVLEDAAMNGSLPLEAQIAVNSLNKMNILNHAMGKEGAPTAADILARPDLVKKSLVDNAKETAEKLFIGDNAPLKDIYDSNPTIKNLVDAGMPVNALDALPTGVAMKLKDGSLKVDDLLNGSLKVDHDILSKMVTNKVISSKMPSFTKDQKARLANVKNVAKQKIEELGITDPKKMDEIETSLTEAIKAEGKAYQPAKQNYLSKKDKMFDAVFKYVDDPTEVNLKNLEEVATAPNTHKVTSKKGVTFDRRGKKTFKLFKDVVTDIEKVKQGMFDGEEINDLVNLQVSKWFDGAKSNLPSVTENLMDADQLITAMTVQNRKLLETTAESFQRSAMMKNDDLFVNIKTEEAKGLREAIKLRDMEFEYSQLMASHNNFQNQLKAVDDPFEKIAFRERLKNIRDRQQTLIGSMRDSEMILKSMNTAENPTGMDDILKKASEIFAPQETMYKKAGVSFEQARGAIGTADRETKKDMISGGLRKALDNIIDSGAGKNEDFIAKADPVSPWAVKNGSEMQKEMAYLMVSGFDFNSNYGGKFGSKAALSLKKELGENSAVAKFVVDGYKDREIVATNIKKFYTEEFKKLGIKSRSTEDRLIKYFGELLPEDAPTVSEKTIFMAKGGKSHAEVKAEWDALPDDVRAKVESGIAFFRKTYDGLHKTMNEVNKLNGLKEIGYIKNYFSYYSKDNELAKTLDNYFKGIGENFQNTTRAPKDPAGSSSIFASFKKQRKTIDSLGKGYASDGLLPYLETSSKVISFSDYVRQIDSMMGMAPDNMKAFLKSVKEEKVFGISDFDNAFTKGNKFEKGMLSGIRFLDRQYTAAQLAFKVSTALAQVSSSAFAFAENGPHAIKAAMSVLNPRQGSQVKNILAKSKNLAIRSSHIGGLDNLDGNFGKMIQKMIGEYSDGLNPKTLAIKGTKFFSEASMFGVDYFDKLAARHMYLSTFNKSMADGVGEDAAHLMADYAVDKFHTDLSKIGRAAYQNSSLGRAATRFTSWTNNLFAGLLTDLPRLEQKEGTAKMVGNLMKMTANMEIMNEIYGASGLPRPFDVLSMVPVIGYGKFGPTGVTNLVIDSTIGAAAFIDYDMNERERAWKLKTAQKTIIGQVIPPQFIRSWDAITKNIDGEFKGPNAFSEFAQALAFGPYWAKRTQGEEKKIIKERKTGETKNPFSKPRLFLKKSIEKGLR